MRKLLIGLFILSSAFVFMEDSDAFIRRIKARRNTSYSTSYSAACNTSYSTGYTYTSSNWGSTAAEIAQAKAEYQATRNSCFHPGGGFGGCTYEGVGAAMTAQGALNNCCYTGQRYLVASGVAQGSNGMWYACKLFR